MMYPYARFLIDFDQRNASFTHRNRTSNKKAAFFIENRPLYFVPMVIKNVMFFLGSEWNLHVVYGDASQSFLEDALKDWDVNGIKLEGIGGFWRRQRSEIMKTTRFWKIFSEEKVLIFESNSVACGTDIAPFEIYDFIGAPLGTPDSFTFHGGFSLRSRLRMIECIVKGKTSEDEPEDAFFSRMMRQIGAVNPDFVTACRFALSSTYEGQPVGVPATDECFHTPDVAQRIVAEIRY